MGRSKTAIFSAASLTQSPLRIGCCSHSFNTIRRGFRGFEGHPRASGTKQQNFTHCSLALCFCTSLCISVFASAADNERMHRWRWKGSHSRRFISLVFGNTSISPRMQARCLLQSQCCVVQRQERVTFACSRRRSCSKL